jgi:GNAT superfamily N-acetyltransferase
MRSLAVHPDYSRRGLATALTNAVIDANGGPIDLLVEPQNDAAIALYEKLGFRVSEPGLSLGAAHYVRGRSIPHDDDDDDEAR